MPGTSGLDDSNNGLFRINSGVVDDDEASLSGGEARTAEVTSSNTRGELSGAEPQCPVELDGGAETNQQGDVIVHKPV